MHTERPFRQKGIVDRGVVQRRTTNPSEARQVFVYVAEVSVSESVADGCKPHKAARVTRRGGVYLKKREGVRGRAQRLARGASEASPHAFTERVGLVD